MKKGLLSVLAVAITIVGCQDYDDQFDSLNQQIQSLSAQVSANGDSTSSLAASIASLQASLTALESQVDTDNAAVAAQIAEIQTALDNVATATDLDPIEEDIQQLLDQNSFAQGPINLTNHAELAYVQTLGDFKNVRGNFTVDVTTSAMRDSIDAVNAILSRIGIITAGDLTLTGHASVTLDASALTFVDGNLSVTGNAAKLDALQSVTSGLTLTYGGDYDFATLIGAGSITLTDNAKTTTVNFPNITGTGSFQTAGATSSATFAAATTINIGDLELKSLTAPKATAVTLGFDGTASGATAISATTSGSVINLSVTSAGTHAYTVTGSSNSTVNINGLKTTGNLSITGGTVNAAALATVSGTFSIAGAKSLSLPALTTVNGTSTFAAATSFSAPKWVVSATSTFTAATSIELASAANALISPVNVVKTLTLGALADGVAFNASALSALETLNVTGAAAKTSGEGNQDNSVTASSATALKTVTVGGTLGSLDLMSNAALTTINTSGNIVNANVASNAALTGITFGHTFVSGDLASTVTITSNAKLASVNMETLQKVRTISITNNALLTSIKVGAVDTNNLAEPVAVISYTITRNKLSGKYTVAKAGTQTTPYTAPVIVQSDLAAVKAILDAYIGYSTTTPTYNLDFDDDTATASPTNDKLSARLDADTVAQKGQDNIDGTADDDSNNKSGGAGAGTGIDTARELALLKAS